MQQILYYDEYYAQKNQKLKEFLETKKYESVFNNIGHDVVLVLGGDGTILQAIHKHQDKQIPFLGINFGHKGYLLSDETSLWETEFIKKQYPLLEIETQIGDKKQTFFAVNELDIDAAKGKMLELEIEIEGKTTMSLRGDGLIISTPAGSTAYNRSLGGPIIPHDVEAFVLTPKAPNYPLAQPAILLSQEETISIKNTGRKHEALLFADGQELCCENQTDFSLTLKKSNTHVTFLVGKNYESTWDTKPLMEQGFTPKK